MQVRHLVFLKIKNELAVPPIREALKNLSVALKCEQFDFGKCTGASDLYHYFFIDFGRKEALDSYLIDDRHTDIAQRIIIPELVPGSDSVYVFDYTLSRTKSISNLRKSQGFVGYVLIKEGEEHSVLKELTKHCSLINHYKPMVNCSQEEYGKKHPYAMKIQLKEGVEPVSIKSGLPFWASRERTITNDEQLSLQNKMKTVPSTRSKL